MDLELHQLDLRYEPLRRRAPEMEKRLLASMAHWGQQAPIVVVAGEGAARVVVDGYKRVRALRQLRADTVVATAWDLAEAEALTLQWRMRAGGDDIFEQAWLLRELQHRFNRTREELARHFEKSESWVSRRIALVEQLPEEIQERVRSGHLVAHAAMRYLVPLARANRAACVKLVAALGKARPTSRQMGALYGAWLGGDQTLRGRLEADPWLFLRAQEEANRKPDPDDRPPAQQLLADLGALGGISRRASRRLRSGLVKHLSPPERHDAEQCLAQTRAETEAFFLLLQKELS